LGGNICNLFFHDAERERTPEKKNGKMEKEKEKEKKSREEKKKNILGIDPFDRLF